MCDCYQEEVEQQNGSSSAGIFTGQNSKAIIDIINIFIHTEIHLIQRFNIVGNSFMYVGKKHFVYIFSIG